MNGGKVLLLCSKEGSDGGDRIGGGLEEENPIPDRSKGGSQNCFGGAEEGHHHQTVGGCHGLDASPLDHKGRIKEIDSGGLRFDRDRPVLTS